MSAYSLTEWMTSRLPAVDRALGRCFEDAAPPRFQEACRYPLGTGGKRMRPMLVIAAAEAVVGPDGALPAGVMDAAVAIELVHTYSLVHDDLPCMDNDDFRRGQPTVHRVYGDAVAVLVGDALLTEAFVVLSRQGPATADLVRTLARAAGAGGMISGQALDIGLAGPVTELDPLVMLHRAKTGALLKCAARLGGLVAGASDAQIEALDAYGEALGLAFQVHDDLLDADQDARSDGVPSFVRVLGREGTVRAAHEYAARASAALDHFERPEALLALARFAVDRGC